MKKFILLLLVIPLLVMPSCHASDPTFEPIYIGDDIHLVDDGQVWVEFRAELDPTKLSVNAKPTIITRGIAYGYSLPVGGADEELFLNICVPGRWDGESAIHVHVRAWLDTAQDNALDAVKLQLDYVAVGVGEVIPDTSTPLTSEVVTGIVPQFTDIEFSFDIPYATITDDAVLFMHLTRIASSQEIDGEPVITDTGTIFRFDKLGNQTP